MVKTRQTHYAADDEPSGPRSQGQRADGFRNGDASSRRIAVVSTAGANAFELSALVQAFTGANAVAGRALYDVGVAAPAHLAPAMFGVEQPGFSVMADHPLTWAEGADTVVVPSLGRYLDPPDDLLDAVTESAQRAARIVSVGLGAYVLATARLLDGRMVTTHWNWTEDLAGRFPSVRVQSGRLLVQDGRYHSSAGGAATFDLAVQLVRQDHGAELADALARYLVIADRRDEKHQQPRMPRTPADAFEESLRWSRLHLSADISVSDLATRSRMSERTFSRRFRRAIGTSPLDWLLGLRISRAEELLTRTDWTVTRIAEESGFRSESALRYHFRQRKAASPSAYRRAARGLARPRRSASAS